VLINIAGIVLVAQALDNFIIGAFGATYAFQVYPELGWFRFVDDKVTEYLNAI